jgi:CDP-6-deoxy-D-xylo-4-hexulose-3-dehydrase
MPRIDLPLCSSSWDHEEYEALERVIKSDRFTLGQEVETFELAFAQFHSSKFAVMFNSGSSANLAAATAIKLTSSQDGTRNKVIVPSVGWSTTYFPFTQNGFELVFVDIDIDTWNMNTDQLAAAIDGQTAIVCVVNLLGNPGDLKSIKELTEQTNSILIEDNCESLGAIEDGQLAGTWGKIGTFSTYYSHHISTIEGGVCLTDDETLAAVLRSTRAHGWIRDISLPPHLTGPVPSDEWSRRFSFALPGYNLRPIEFEGALGSAQLRKLPSLLSVRRQNGKFFESLFGDFNGLRIQKMKPGSSWFSLGIVLEGKFQGKRESIIGDLESMGVETRPIVTGNFLTNPVISHLPHTVAFPPLVAAHIHDDGFMIGNHGFSIESKLEQIHKYFLDLSQRL